VIDDFSFFACEWSGNEIAVLVMMMTSRWTTIEDRVNSRFVVLLIGWNRVVELTTESVEGATLTLERIDDVHRGDRLSASMLGVGDCITDDMLEEHLEDSSGLLIDETADTLDSTSTRETTDGRLGDTLDVITQHLTMTLRATLAETLSTLTATGHS
jgi:hypothetical protein